MVKHNSGVEGERERERVITAPTEEITLVEEKLVVMVVYIVAEAVRKTHRRPSDVQEAEKNRRARTQVMVKE